MLHTGRPPTHIVPLFSVEKGGRINLLVSDYHLVQMEAETGDILASENELASDEGISITEIMLAQLYMTGGARPTWLLQAPPPRKASFV
jgi:hypothetical protein